MKLDVHLSNSPSAVFCLRLFSRNPDEANSLCCLGLHDLQNVSGKEFSLLNFDTMQTIRRAAPHWEDSSKIAFITRNDVGNFAWQRMQLIPLTKFCYSKLCFVAVMVFWFEIWTCSGRDCVSEINNWLFAAQVIGMLIFWSISLMFRLYWQCHLDRQWNISDPNAKLSSHDLTEIINCYLDLEVKLGNCTWVEMTLRILKVRSTFISLSHQLFACCYITPKR